MRSIWRIVTLVPEYRGRIFWILTASAIAGLVGTASPYIFRQIINVVAGLLAHRLSHAQAVRMAEETVAAFIALRLLLVVANYFLEKMSDSLWLNTISTLRQRVFDKMTGVSLDYYERVRVGDVMERFSAVTSITQWLFQLSEGVLSNTLQLFFGTAVLLVKAPLVGGIMLGLVPLNLFVSFREVSRTKPLRRKWTGLVGKMSGLLSEMVSQITMVRSFAGEGAVKKRYDDAQSEWWEIRNVEKAIEHRSGIILSIVNMLAVVVSVVLVTAGALDGRYTIGDILLVLTLTQMIITNIQPIARLINNTGEVDTAAERLAELLDVVATVTDRPGASVMPPLETIEFRNVDFAYPGKPQLAIRNVSFRVAHGEMLALVGLSGSGKSTIIKLLMRFYDPTAGAILINGQDIRNFTQSSLRAQFGAVLQDVALFNDTIADNIRFARPGASDEEVVAAAEASRADAFIRQFPDGYSTLVGERGVRLSGGEKQRVAIARALLREPRLIVLDEATSALDSQTERLVQEGLNRLMTGRTSIVIAHRLSTITRADKIIVMQNGEVVESGTHASLVQTQSGLYAELHALQSAVPELVA